MGTSSQEVRILHVGKIISGLQYFQCVDVSNILLQCSASRFIMQHFSHYLLPCPVIDCGTLTKPDNGSVTQTGTSLGSVATYNCDEGTVLIGRDNRTCQEDETWSGEAPICKIARGPPDPDRGDQSHPTNPSHPTLSPDSVTQRTDSNSSNSKGSRSLVYSLIIGSVIAFLLLLVVFMLFVIVIICVRRRMYRNATDNLQQQNSLENPIYTGESCTTCSEQSMYL